MPLDLTSKAGRERGARNGKACDSKLRVFTNAQVEDVMKNFPAGRRYLCAYLRRHFASASAKLFCTAA